MGRGRGKTPEIVVELLKEAVAKKSQYAVAKETGLGLAVINRYLRGIGEPTAKTMEILAGYFGVSVAYLRGHESDEHLNLLIGIGHLLKTVLEVDVISEGNAKERLISLANTFISRKSERKTIDEELKVFDGMAEAVIAKYSSFLKK